MDRRAAASAEDLRSGCPRTAVAATTFPFTSSVTETATRPPALTLLAEEGYTGVGNLIARLFRLPILTVVLVFAGGVGVLVGVGVAVLVGVGVTVGVAVTLPFEVLVFVGVGVAEGLGVGVSEGDGEGVADGDGVERLKFEFELKSGSSLTFELRLKFRSSRLKLVFAF